MKKYNISGRVTESPRGHRLLERCYSNVPIIVRAIFHLVLCDTALSGHTVTPVFVPAEGPELSAQKESACNNNDAVSERSV